MRTRRELVREQLDHFGREMRDFPFTLMVNSLGSAALTPSLARTALLRLAGLDLDWGVSVAPGVRIRGRELSIRSGCTINSDCLFDCRAQVSIGRNCGIGFGVRFITTDHSSENPRKRAGVGSLKGIAVGEGVWIGSGVTLLPGVKVGDGAVIAAGAVVADDCKPHLLYGGIPARELRELPTHQNVATVPPD